MIGADIVKENERISWNVIKGASVSNTPSESSFKSVLDRDNRNNDINIVLNVAPRTKLGLGICKGPEWKPGIFVQFTKDKSVAREAGLRQGDQILSVNSIDFSDVLFSEAVAVMKGSNKLEMVVRTAAGCDLFPGESSGYNSSASSVTGDQSPCWADAKSKRLTAVREEPNVTACWNESLYAEHRSRDSTLTLEEKKSKTRQVNKTIIKLSENGASINNTYVANTQTRRTIQQEKNNTINMPQYHQTTSTAAIPPPPPPVQITELNMKMSQNLQNNCYGTIQTDTKSVQVEVHRNGIVEKCQSQQSTMQRCSNSNDTMTHTKYKLTANTTNTLNNCRPSNSDVGGSSLSSAITEELKKRKEKKRLNAAVAANTNTNNNSNSNSNFNFNFNNSNSNNNVNNSSQINCNNKTNISHNNQQQQSSTLRQQQIATSRGTAPTAIPPPPTNSSGGSSSVARTINSANVNCIEQQRNSTAAGGNCSSSNNNNNTNNNVGDHHSALMDEFKRAHQRMFKNGFQESERKERQEALKRTTIMEDDVNHRSSRIFNSDVRSSNEKLINGSENGIAGQQINNIPPPPPQFANSPPKTNQNNISTQKSSNLTTLKQPSTANTATMVAQEPLKPPTSPTPDYDNVQLRKTVTRPNVYSTNVGSRDTLNNTAVNSTGNRRTMRLGTVTIGEYEQQRKEPTKFEFISAQKRNTNTELSNTENLHAELQNTLTRSNLKKPNGHAMEHKSDCPLQNGTSSTDNLNRKMQGVSIGNRTSSFKTESYQPVKNIQNMNGNAITIGTGNGILKNGNRLSNNGFNKSTDKSITFGNSQKF
ncbi:putative uncharacterized protein DDB_G0286901 [Teleopsis dalmanni]|uniref:putative uncharacterized protein DDB_G0286901 n=1 Tax=Teleopsis dalmanni TaxID=139649 RepID=UPI0018CE9910|nr:putative uncharacterized protein DDB_G0286901 [Teleopsis dalmanni]